MLPSKRFGFYILISILCFMSCTDGSLSRQDYVDILAAGDWNMTSNLRDGIEQDLGGELLSYSQTHDDCEIAKESCWGSRSTKIALENGKIEEVRRTFKYSIDRSRNNLTFNFDKVFTNGFSNDCYTGCNVTYTILNFTNTRYELERNLANGSVLNITMERH